MKILQTPTGFRVELCFKSEVKQKFKIVNKNARKIYVFYCAKPLAHITFECKKIGVSLIVSKFEPKNRTLFISTYDK